MSSHPTPDEIDRMAEEAAADNDQDDGATSDPQDDADLGSHPTPDEVDQLAERSGADPEPESESEPDQRQQIEQSPQESQEYAQRSVQVQAAAEVDGIQPRHVEVDRIDPSEQRQREELARHLPADEARNLQTGPVSVGITDEGEEELVRQQVEEEHPDANTEVYREDGELQVEVDEERDTRAGRWLEDRSDEWQSGAEWIGDQTRDVVPDVPVIVTGPGGVPRTTDEDLSDVTGGAAETAVSTVDPAGGTLFAGDVVSGARDEAGAWSSYRSDQVDDLYSRDADDVRDDPGGTAELGLDALTGAGHIRSRSDDAAAATMGLGASAGSTFQDRPIESTARGFAGLAAAFAGPTVAVRGGRRARDLDWEPRGDMISRGPDRGQMEMTIQRQRQADPERPDPDDLPVRHQPADPTAPTPEGRVPPRDAFQSEEMYQQAVRRRREEIQRENVDQLPQEEAAQQTQTQAAFGDPSLGDSTTTAAATTGPSVDSSFDFDSAFADPTAETTSAEATVEPDATSFETGLASDLETRQESMMETGTTTTADSTAMSGPSTTTAMDEPMQTISTTAFGRQPSRGGRAMRPDLGDDQSRESGFGGFEEGAAGWETGFAQPEDILDDDDEEWWF